MVNVSKSAVAEELRSALMEIMPVIQQLRAAGAEASSTVYSNGTFSVEVDGISEKFPLTVGGARDAVLHLSEALEEARGAADALVAQAAEPVDEEAEGEYAATEYESDDDEREAL